MKARTWSKGRRLCVEVLEPREAPAIDISGNVFQTLDLAGLFPQPAANFLAPLEGVEVSLDDGTPVETGADGTYSFPGVGDGTHTIAVTLPKGFLATSSLEYTLVVGPSSTNFANLNFALTPRQSALVQNLFELVLSRPAELDEFNKRTQSLENGTPVGQVFQSLLRSAEFKSLSAPVANLLGAFFSGPLDVGQFRNAVQLENLGVSQDAVVLQVLYSQPFVDRFGDTSLLSNTAYVDFLYERILKRDPTGGQLNKWVGQLQSGAADRGDVALALVKSAEFATARPNVANSVGVSLAYLGVLGREVTKSQLSQRLAELRAGSTLSTIATQLAASNAFRKLTAYTDTFVWDVRAHQIAPGVNVLERLEQYNPTTQQFDLQVDANSITSNGSTNAYFIAHGWAPGFTEEVLLNSTPGNPARSWLIEDPNFLADGTAQISAEGLAQAIIDFDPNAVVFAFSWIDQSATPQSDAVTSFTLPGNLTAGQNVVSGVDTSTLVAGMTVTGPGLPAGTVVVSVDSATQLTLSANALATLSGVSLTYAAPGLAVVSETGAITSGSAVVTDVDTSRLSVGMTVAGGGIPLGTTVASIDSATQVTLSANATATAASTALTFKGTDLGQALSEFIYSGQSESYTQLNGLRLAAAIEQALATSFLTNDGLIHILGHSHGAKVATVATLALQQSDVPVAQLTLFESPEVGPLVTLDSIPLETHLAAFGGAQNFLWYYLAQMDLSRSPVGPGRTSDGSTFVDNYFSNEGFGSAFGGVNASAFGSGNLSSIVDVRFYAEHLYGALNPKNPFASINTLFGSHDYPPPWYGQASLNTTEYGLNWSPLINPTTAAGLDDFYEQNPAATTPGQFVIDQFQLQTGTQPTYTPTTPVAVQYAQQYTVGAVADSGSEITLTINESSPLAMDVITFNPINVGALDLGAGMDFEFTFSNVPPGEQVELQVWIHGLAGVPVLDGVLGSTLGPLSIPLFSMNGADAGTASQRATVSLGGFFSVDEFGHILTGPFNAVNNGLASTLVPTLGFTLSGAVSSSVQVTVSNLRQFNDGSTFGT